ncbi:MAG: 5-methyltetrahydropteroyltriglutamate--homocysteine methyltransferase, partial [Duncaniella sp.]|nr:5-methyltetrahydropteroyltriglutamate--homocysteine methyltransferase [Duncaniella sp.]
MTLSQTRPRVEIVGSFLQPEELEIARSEMAHGAKSVEEVREIEDAVINRLIDREIESGLKIVTDGEIRRKRWDQDFWEGLEGMSRERIDTGRVY